MTVLTALAKLSEKLKLNANFVFDNNPRTEETKTIYDGFMIIAGCLDEIIKEAEVDEVGVCVECFTLLHNSDSLAEIDAPDIYECPACGHPNGPITKE